LEPRPLFCNPILTHLAIFIAKNAFRDYKNIDERLNIEPSEEEMFQLELDPHVLDLPLYQKNNGEVELAVTLVGVIESWASVQDIFGPLQSTTSERRVYISSVCYLVC
jgi:hypothetical protein